MTKYLRAALLVILLTATFVSCRTERPNPQPNVVVILMDDMGYGDLEAYGGTGYEMPYTNKLAAQGMRFTNFYAAQAVCSASRAALLTGCYPNRIGIHGALMPWSHIALHPDEETMAEMLKKAGYHTGMVGKWHLGDDKPYLPLQQGFDEYFGLPYSNDMWPVNYDGKPVIDSTNRKYRYPPLALIDGNEKVREIKTLADQAQLTTFYTDRACRFIRDNKDNRFFLYLAHSMPHVPIAASNKFKGKSVAGLYGDVMMELDWSVGQVMKTLHNLGLDEKTLVILTSDNGPWRNFGNHAGSTGGLREGKGTSYEGGQREPCIMRWTGKIPAGSVCNKLASTIDVLPTLAALCGAPLPEKKIDGVDISALLMNEIEADPRPYFIYYYQNNSLEAVRKGPWKLVFPHRHRTYLKSPPGHDGWPGAQPSDSTGLALYNLQMDPGETIDVQKAFPEVVNDLQALGDRYRAELGDDLTGQPGRARRPAATVK